MLRDRLEVATVKACEHGTAYGGGGGVVVGTLGDGQIVRLSKNTTWTGGLYRGVALSQPPIVVIASGGGFRIQICQISHL